MIRKGLVVALVLLALPGIALAATTYNLTDSSSGVPGTYYELTITDLGGGSYSGVLSADVISASGWYINWWDLQFDGSSPTAVSLSVSGNLSASEWDNFVDGSVDPKIDLVGFPNRPQNNRILAYTDGIEDDGSSYITGGALLDGTSTYQWTFSFSLTNGLEPIAFEVGYYDGLACGSSNILKTQLSQ